MRKTPNGMIFTTAFADKVGCFWIPAFAGMTTQSSCPWQQLGRHARENGHPGKKDWIPAFAGMTMMFTK